MWLTIILLGGGAAGLLFWPDHRHRWFWATLCVLVAIQVFVITHYHWRELASPLAAQLKGAIVITGGIDWLVLWWIHRAFNPAPHLRSKTSIATEWATYLTASILIAAGIAIAHAIDTKEILFFSRAPIVLELQSGRARDDIEHCIFSSSNNRAWTEVAGSPPTGRFYYAVRNEGILVIDNRTSRTVRILAEARQPLGPGENHRIAACIG